MQSIQTKRTENSFSSNEMLKIKLYQKGSCIEQDFSPPEIPQISKFLPQDTDADIILNFNDKSIINYEIEIYLVPHNIQNKDEFNEYFNTSSNIKPANPSLI